MSPLLLLRRPSLLVSLAVHGAAVVTAYLTVLPGPATPAASFTAGAVFESLVPASVAPLEAPASPDLADALPAAAPEAPAEVVVEAESPLAEVPASADPTIRIPADLAARPLPLSRTRASGVAEVPASVGAVVTTLLPSPRRAGPGGPTGPSVGLAGNVVSYPESARTRGVEGVTWIRVTVLEDGTVGDVTVEASSGDADLDAAAVAGVRRWRFAPALADGRPTKDVYVTSVRFRLR